LIGKRREERRKAREEAAQAAEDELAEEAAAAKAAALEEVRAVAAAAVDARRKIREEHARRREGAVSGLGGAMRVAEAGEDPRWAGLSDKEKATQRANKDAEQKRRWQEAGLTGSADNVTADSFRHLMF